MDKQTLSINDIYNGVAVFDHLLKKETDVNINQQINDLRKRYILFLKDNDSNFDTVIENYNIKA